MLYKDITIAEAHGAGDEVPETINDPITGEPAFKVVYEHTDAWRGYYETKPLDGCRWKHIEGNWVGGTWEDCPEENRSDLVQARIDKMAETRTLFIVIAGSSNVFSTPYDLYELISE